MDFLPGQTVRFVGGKYNGFQGTVRWAGDENVSVVISYENRPVEIVEETRFLHDLRAWRASKSIVEQQLRGAS